MEGNLDHPIAPTGIVKDEPLDEPNLEGDQEECSEDIIESLRAYLPLPHGVKEESPLEDDGHDEFNSGVQVENKGHDEMIMSQEDTEHQEYLGEHSPIATGVVKEEPTSDGDYSDDGCELVAYPSLPHGVIKEESEIGDGCDEISSGQKSQQEGNKNLTNEAVEDVPIIVQSVDIFASGNENKPAEPQNNKRKRAMKDHRSSEVMPNSSRVLRNRSKGGSTVKNYVGGVKQLEAEELAMEECDVGAKEQQNADFDTRSEHSSLDGVISTDDEDLVPNYSLASSAQRKKKSAKKMSVKANHSQEKEKLPFKCPNCGNSFKIDKYLTQHLASVCGIERKFSCKECSNLFKKKQHLQRHLIVIHNVEKSQLASFGAGSKIRPVLPFKCDKCSRTYKQKSGLLQHMKYECEVDPSFACHLCHYRATRKGSLKNHLMTVHDVDRSQFTALRAAAPETRPVQPFKCEKCGKTYKHKNVLTRHLKYECGVGPSFACTQCNYQASLKSHLKKHLINVHAGAGLSQNKTKKL